MNLTILFYVLIIEISETDIEIVNNFVIKLAAFPCFGGINVLVHAKIIFNKIDWNYYYVRQ